MLQGAYEAFTKLPRGGPGNLPGVGWVGNYGEFSEMRSAQLHPRLRLPRDAHGAQNTNAPPPQA